MARTLPRQPQVQQPSPDLGPTVAEPGGRAGRPVQGAVRSRRPAIAGAIGGAWAFGVGIALVTCLVMLAWAVSPNSAGDSATAWRAAGLTWLAAHLVPLQVAGQPLTALPIGGLLLGLLLTRRSGAWTGRLLPEPSPAEVGWIAAGAALLYGAGGGAVAWLSAAPATAAAPARAALVTGLVAAIGTTWGIGREAGLVSHARRRLRDATWRTVAAGLASTVGLFAAGAALVTASLVVHFAAVGGTLADLDAGAVGAGGLTLLGALSLPNLAIWAAAVIVGPGFSLGSLGSLSAFGGEVGALPALPVLAAIPTTAPAWAPVLLVVPVLLGILAGRIRWGRDLPTPLGALTAALGLGGVVAVLLAGMMWLASGSLGDGRLADVGPYLVPVVAAGTGLVVLGFLLEAGLQSARLTWELHRAEQRAAALQAQGEAQEVAAVEVVATPEAPAALLEVASDVPDPAAAEVVGPGVGRVRSLVVNAASPSSVRVRGVAAALGARLGRGGMAGGHPERGDAERGDAERADAERADAERADAERADAEPGEAAAADEGTTDAEPAGTQRGDVGAAGPTELGHVHAADAGPVEAGSGDEGAVPEVVDVRQARGTAAPGELVGGGAMRAGHQAAAALADDRGGDDPEADAAAGEDRSGDRAPDARGQAGADAGSAEASSVAPPPADDDTVDLPVVVVADAPASAEREPTGTGRPRRP